MILFYLRLIYSNIIDILDFSALAFFFFFFFSETNSMQKVRNSTESIHNNFKSFTLKPLSSLHSYYFHCLREELQY